MVFDFRGPLWEFGTSAACFEPWSSRAHSYVILLCITAVSRRCRRENDAILPVPHSTKVLVARSKITRCSRSVIDLKLHRPSKLTRLSTKFLRALLAWMCVNSNRRLRARYTNTIYYPHSNVRSRQSNEAQNRSTLSLMLTVPDACCT
ncbi:unnamed protein product, partial [Sphacelaria rigidula]